MAQRRSPTESSCAGCGAAIEGGAAACQRLFDEFRARETATLARDYRSTRLTVDVYCLQHPERYCVSAKSLAAHLTGLAWARERDGGEDGLRVLQRWLDAPGDLVKPPLPAARGAVTIVDVAPANDPDDYLRRLDLWASSTWEAYSGLHRVALDWIDLAFGSLG